MSLSDDIADTCRLEGAVANEELQPTWRGIHSPISEPLSVAVCNGGSATTHCIVISVTERTGLCCLVEVEGRPRRAFRESLSRFPRDGVPGCFRPLLLPCLWNVKLRDVQMSRCCLHERQVRGIKDIYSLDNNLFLFLTSNN